MLHCLRVWNGIGSAAQHLWVRCSPRGWSVFLQEPLISVQLRVFVRCPGCGWRFCCVGCWRGWSGGCSAESLPEMYKHTLYVTWLPEAVNDNRGYCVSHDAGTDWTGLGRAACVWRTVHVRKFWGQFHSYLTLNTLFICAGGEKDGLVQGSAPWKVTEKSLQLGLCWHRHQATDGKRLLQVGGVINLHEK